MKSTKKSLKIVLISAIALLFLPLKLIILNNNLVPINGVIKEVEKSSTRIPYYKFRLSDDSTIYYNSGRGLLSNIKTDKEVLYNGKNKEISFYISKVDFSKLNKGEEIKYIGLEKRNVLIDLYYHSISGLWNVVLGMLCIVMMALNTYAVYTYKKKVFEVFIIIYMLLGISMLML
ncbi:hypothetical protein SAMN05660841_00278 [Sphingobacterium nematocida]|uniref:Uncharacterized protein n=1 Tax=Sphingobacterium nematocida TaxID=1513896 RepID=A0A1T5AXL0_9SPHI|nr:hypothetical protein [Sphingobacterium nematocida]SKB39791.1 hypothetical protein SAMN05660841_00278 [Sphingobacterium nematocida]